MQSYKLELVLGCRYPKTQFWMKERKTGEDNDDTYTIPNEINNPFNLEDYMLFMQNYIPHCATFIVEKKT